MRTKSSGWIITCNSNNNWTEAKPCAEGFSLKVQSPTMQWKEIIHDCVNARTAVLPPPSFQHAPSQIILTKQFDIGCSSYCGILTISWTYLGQSMVGYILACPAHTPPKLSQMCAGFGVQLAGLPPPCHEI